MKPAPLPVELGSVFTVQEALASGVGVSRLRRTDLTRPFRGLRTTDSPASSDSPKDLQHLVTARALQYARIMPSQSFFTHVTSAVLWGLPLPRSLFRATSETMTPHATLLDVGVFSPDRNLRTAGVRGHEVAARRAHVVRHPQFGVSLASPASTWAMLGSVLRQHDVIALGDAVVRERIFSDDPPPLASLAQLDAAVRSGRRVGIRRLREAVPFVRTRSASRTESLTRMLIIDAGLPEPELNWSVFDAGLLVACVDLAYPALLIAVEYEGEHHLLDPVQWSKDIARYERLAALGWIVIRVTKHDLFSDPDSIVRRIRSARKRRS